MGHTSHIQNTYPISISSMHIRYAYPNFVPDMHGHYEPRICLSARHLRYAYRIRISDGHVEYSYLKCLSNTHILYMHCYLPKLHGRSGRSRVKWNRVQCIVPAISKVISKLIPHPMRGQSTDFNRFDGFVKARSEF